MKPHSLVVADTSPLNYLIRLGHADVLRDIFGEIAVPEAVIDELSHRESPPEVRSWASNPPAWIERIRVSTIDTSLSPLLGAGEREAISLARFRGASLLILDDYEARVAATARNLEITGTLAILREAALRGHLGFPEAVRRLKSLGFRISQKLESAVLGRYQQETKSKRG